MELVPRDDLDIGGVTFLLDLIAFSAICDVTLLLSVLKTAELTFVLSFYHC